MNLYAKIEEFAEYFRAFQNQDGSMPPGHNGPYCDPETPVRNTAHWLFTFSNLYERTGEKKWAKAANKAADYLCSKEARPMGATFWVRKNPHKDFCNGLIGQAWAIEGLIKAAEVLEREDCYKTAEEVFMLHPFDQEKSIWQRVNVDGSYASYDSTFNHQLWFAAIASQLSQTKIAKERSLQFLDNVGTGVGIYKDGVVIHNSLIIPNKTNRIFNPYSILKKTYKKYHHNNKKKKLYLKSVGYHAFNIYAFALLKTQFSDHVFFSSVKLKKMLSVLDSETFIKYMDKSPYGYWYNPPGIEIPFSLEVLGGSYDLAQRWIDLQASKTFNNETGSLISKGSPDPTTSDARIYEALRIKNNYTVNI